MPTLDAQLFSAYILPATLAVIMGGMGLSLMLDDFKNVVMYPKSVLVGLLAQMVGLPLTAFAVAWLAPVSPELKVGLVLIGICPGGASSNLVSFMVRANVALSITLTAVNSMLTFLSIPLLLNLALTTFMDKGTYIELPVEDTMLQILLVVAVPVSIGMAIRHWFPGFSKNATKYLDYILPLLLLVAFAGVLFLDQGEDGGNSFQRGNFLEVLAFAFLLHLANFAQAYLVPRPFGVKKNNRLTILIETSLQNSGLAIFIARSLLENQAMAEVAVAYGSFTFFTTLGVAWGAKQLWLKRFGFSRLPGWWRRVTGG